MIRRRHLTLVHSDKKQEAQSARRLYPYETRKVRAELRPTPTPPRTAA